MVRTCWLYYFSKFIELLDTVSIGSLIKEVVMFPLHTRRAGSVGGINCFLFSPSIFAYSNIINMFTPLLSLVICYPTTLSLLDYKEKC